MNIQINDEAKCKEIINKTASCVQNAFKQLRDDLGGKVPADFAMGFVAGYLRGNKFNMEESMFAAVRFASIVEEFIGPPEMVKDCNMKVSSPGDGTAKIEMDVVKT